MNYRLEFYQYGIDRREAAKALGLSYSALCGRLNGFARWQPSEEYKLQKWIEAEKAKRAGVVELVNK